MSKRGIGKYITFAAVLGAVAAGISYFTKYKSFHKELEEDFHDFEDEFDDGFKETSEEPLDKEPRRNYVSIHRDSESDESQVSSVEDAAAKDNIQEDNILPKKEGEGTANPSNSEGSVQIFEDEEMYQ